MTSCPELWKALLDEAPVLVLIIGSFGDPGRGLQLYELGLPLPLSLTASHSPTALKKQTGSQQFSAALTSQVQYCTNLASRARKIDHHIQRTT